MARKPPPFMKKNNDKNNNDKGRMFGGKRAAPFNDRKPPRKGK